MVSQSEEIVGQRIPRFLVPMRLARILDRSFYLLPLVFKKTLIFFVVLTLFQLALDLPEVSNDPLLRELVYGGWLLLQLVLFICVMLIAIEIWFRNETSIQKVFARVPAELFVKFLLLLFWLTLATSFVPFVFEKLVQISSFIQAGSFWINLGYLISFLLAAAYLLPRVLAVYVLLIERAGLAQSLKKSRRLMSGGRIYKADHPIWKFLLLALALVGLGCFSGVFSAGLQLLTREAKLSLPLSYFLVFTVILMQQLINAYGYICLVGFYVDRRVRCQDEL